MIDPKIYNIKSSEFRFKKFDILISLTRKMCTRRSGFGIKTEKWARDGLALVLNQKNVHETV